MKRILCAVLALFLLLAAGCGEALPKEINKETLKVGVICLAPRSQKNGDGVAFGKQAIAACKGAGLKTSQLIIKTDIPAANGAFARDAVRDCIKRGCALIIGTAEGYAGTMKKLAAEYPTVTFLQMGAADETLQNYHTFRVRTYQGAYLCGVAAAVNSKKDRLGVVAGGTETAERKAQINAFALGARAVNQNATVAAVYTGAEQNETAESDAVLTLAKADCDTLLQLTYGGTVAAAAKELNMKVCSLYTEPADADDTVFFGVRPMLQNVFSDRMRSALHKEAAVYENTYLGYADKALQSFEGGNLGEVNLHEPIAATEKQFLSGFDVFSGRALTVSGGKCDGTAADVTDTDGNVRITADTPLGDAAVQSMDFYVSGVEVLSLVSAD